MTDPAQHMEHVRTLLDAATPGPWRYRTGSEHAVEAGNLNTPILRADMVPYHPDAARRQAQRHANLKLAAAAPALAAALAEARGELARVRGALKAITDEAWDGQTNYGVSTPTLLAGVAALEPGA